MSSLRPNIPDELQRIVSQCLRKASEHRYGNGLLLRDDMRRIRRDTEAGVSIAIPW